MFDAPLAPDLNLIDPSNEVASAAGYTSPNFNPNPSPATSSGATQAMYASMGLSFIGAITSAFSQSSAIKAQGEYESTLARTNSAIAEIQSKQALETGDVLASRKNLETQETVGSLKTQQGASGVDVASGSAAAVRAGVTGVGKIDELTIRNNAARKAWGYQTEAIEDTYKGQFATLTAKAQSSQSLLTGGLAAISGPLAIESTYLRFSRWMGGGGGGGNLAPYPNMATG